MNKVNIIKENKKILLSYSEESIDSTGLKYTKDRSSSELVFNLSEKIDKIDINRSENEINFKISDKIISLNNSNINGTPEDRLISSVKIEHSNGFYEVKILLKDRVKFTYDINNRNQFSLKFNKALNMPVKVVIDPGHGGKDNGAVKNGVNEKDVNIRVSSILLQKLSSLGYNVIMTREGDSYPTLDDRAILANSKDADVFISIHANSAEGKPEINGIETYYFNSQESKKLAESILTQLIESTGSNSRGVKSARFLVIRKTNMPATLLELGFLTNIIESKKLSDPEYQDLLAEAIAKGLNDFIKNNYN